MVRKSISGPKIFIRYPIATETVPSPKAADSMKYEFWFGYMLKPYYVGRLNIKGKRAELAIPKTKEAKINPNEGST